eukprot:TRINITY_DN35981_c0_g1_i1.p1 TRINITY_DN35981_c0_g1~~TRINITY_DN35981_c0_g1_i1.p1  ORF type:complete len:620 (-),score=130.62 TRINITY_DN35981_c0_g1_i1:388-2247(-)
MATSSPLPPFTTERDDESSTPSGIREVPRLSSLENLHRTQESFLTPAVRSWVERLIDTRFDEAISSGEFVPGWVARTCHQGAEASALTANAVQLSEESRLRLEAEVRHLSDAQTQLLAIVDGLAADAEKQSTKANQVRQDGEDLLQSFRRVTTDIEDIRQRQAEERQTLADLRKLQLHLDEQVRQQRNSGEELTAASASLVKLQRDVQACKRDLQNLESQMDVRSTVPQRSTDGSATQEAVDRLARELQTMAEQNKDKVETVFARVKLEREERQRDHADMDRRILSLDNLLHKSANHQEQQVHRLEELQEQVRQLLRDRQVFETQNSAVQRQLKQVGETLENQNLETKLDLLGKAQANVEEKVREMDKLVCATSIRCDRLTENLEQQLAGSKEAIGKAIGELSEQRIQAVSAEQREVEKRCCGIELKLRSLEQGMELTVKTDQLERFGELCDEQFQATCAKLLAGQSMLDNKYSGMEQKLNSVEASMKTLAKTDDIEMFADGLRSCLLEQRHIENSRCDFERRMSSIEACTEMCVQTKEFENVLQLLREELVESLNLARVASESKLSLTERQLRTEFRKEFRKLMESWQQGFWHEFSDIEQDLADTLKTKTHPLISANK